MTSDLVKRLRDVAERPDCTYPAPMLDAADRLEAQEAEIKRLRGALRIAKWYADEFPCSHLPPGKRFVDDLTAIEEALT
jgi:hypothetical protein